MASANCDETLHVASKLSDVKESFKWYSLQSPEFSKLEPRVGHALVSLGNGQLLMIGGGNHNGAFSEIFILDLEPTAEDEAVKLIPHPSSQSFPARYEFLCGKDNLRDCVWLFGGASTTTTTNEVIRIDKDSIVSIAPTDRSPSCRTQGGSCAIVDYNGKQYIVVYAGGLKGEQPVLDRNLYLFDIEAKDWETYAVPEGEDSSSTLFGTAPPAVQGHIMAAVGSKIVLQGGINSTMLYDGFHSLDLKSLTEASKTCTWINHCIVDAQSEKPSARAAHGIARLSDADENSTLLYVFGGMGEKGECNDLWCLNTESMGWAQLTKNKGSESAGFHPLPRLDFAMCAVGLKSENEELSKFIVIHGGMSRTGEIYNDAWIMRV